MTKKRTTPATKKQDNTVTITISYNLGEYLNDQEALLAVTERLKHIDTVLLGSQWTLNDGDIGWVNGGYSSTAIADVSWIETE